MDEESGVEEEAGSGVEEESGDDSDWDSAPEFPSSVSSSTGLCG